MLNESQCSEWPSPQQKLLVVLTNYFCLSHPEAAHIIRNTRDNLP